MFVVYRWAAFATEVLLEATMHVQPWLLEIKDWDLCVCVCVRERERERERERLGLACVSL